MRKVLLAVAAVWLLASAPFRSLWLTANGLWKATGIHSLRAPHATHRSVERR